MSTRNQWGTPICTCHPHRLEVGGFDAGCPVHDREVASWLR